MYLVGKALKQAFFLKAEMGPWAKSRSRKLRKEERKHSAQ